MNVLQWFLGISFSAKAGLIIFAIALIGQWLVPIRGIRMVANPDKRPENMGMFASFWIGVVKFVLWAIIEIIGLFIMFHANAF